MKNQHLSYRSGNPVLTSNAFYLQSDYSDNMTIGGTGNKTFLSLMILIGSAYYSWTYISVTNILLLPSLIGAFIVGIITIRKKIAEIKKVKFDKNRLEQELFYYIEKVDINEELVRLNKHINLLTKTIRSSKSVGKKLNFISQEIGREINTIGSKCSDFKIQKSVINMKEYLEKIKENCYNIF